MPCAIVLAVGARSAAAAEWSADPRVLVSLGVVLGAASIAASLAARTNRAGSFLTAQAATSVLLVLFAAFVAAPGVEERRSVRPLVRELQRRGLDAEVAGAFHERDFSMDFYLGRTLPRATGRRSLQAAVAARPGAIWIVPRANVAQVMSNRRLSVTLVAESPTASALRLAPASPARNAGPSAAPASFGDVVAALQEPAR